MRPTVQNWQRSKAGALVICSAAAVPLVPSLVAAWTSGTGAQPEYQAVLWSLMSVVLAIAMTRRISIGLLVLSPWAILAPAETWYIVTYNRPSDSHVLGVLLDTDLSEARAFVAGQWSWFAAITILVALLCLSASYLAHLQAWRWQTRLRWIVVTTCALGLLAPWLSLWLSPDRVDTALGSRGDQPKPRLEQWTVDPALELFAQSYPAGVLTRVVGFVQQRQHLKQAQETLRDFRFGTSLQAPGQSSRAVHVLVIGESSRPDRWQINGYSKPTNPRLKDQANLVFLPDMISPWSWTRMAVPVILSRKPPVDTSSFFPERSLVSAFKEAGFATAWLSNQSPVGPHDSAIGLYAGEADVIRYVNLGDYRMAGTHDTALLSAVEGLINSGANRQFLVLHTLGSHYNYSHRYPPSFDQFRPSLLDVAKPSLHDRSQRTELGNSYDNSILFTDHFLSELISRLQHLGVESTLLFVSDHGENLFDGDCRKSGHGHHTEFDHRSAALFWYSDEYAAAHAGKVRKLMDHRNQPLYTAQVFDSMLDAAGITFSSHRLENSFFSSKWQPQRRLLQTGLDFDLAARGSLCKELGQQIDRQR